MEATAATSSSDIQPSSKPKKRTGRKIFKETRHPVFHGVRRRGLNPDKWVCEIRQPKKQSRIWLGTYPTPEMAARAHDVAALALKGPKACLNFSDSVWRLPVPESTAASDIRKAAKEGAEMFRPENDQLQFLLSDSMSSTDSSHDQASVLSLPDEVVSSYADQEAVLDYDVAGLMFDLAEGVLMSPSHSQFYNLQMDHFSNDFHGVESVDSACNGELSIWDYLF